MTLFGGKVKTGDASEYMITGLIVSVCVLVIVMRGSAPGGFIPFFYEWSDMYKKGLIDGSEWRLNRFNVT